MTIRFFLARIKTKFFTKKEVRTCANLIAEFLKEHESSTMQSVRVECIKAGYDEQVVLRAMMYLSTKERLVVEYPTDPDADVVENSTYSITD